MIKISTAFPFSRDWVVAVAALLVATAASAAPQMRTAYDVLECEFPDGGRIELKARYFWTPSDPETQTPKARSYNDAAQIRVKIKGDTRWITLKSRLSVGLWPEIQPGASREACASFGSLSRNIYGPMEMIRLADKRVFDEWRPLGINVIMQRQTRKEQEQLASLSANASADFALMIRADGTWVAEQALYGMEDYTTIVAVFKSISNDEGKTWNSTGATRDAEVFTLGKSLEEQSFVAHPLRLNGKRIKLGK